MSAEQMSARDSGRWLASRLAPGARLSADSRRVRPGDGFVAFPGDRSDGRAFIAQAVQRGAAAVVYDADGIDAAPAAGVPIRACPALRRTAGEVASAFYGEPSLAVRLIAITGTNGKTTCANWCAAGLAADGVPSAAIGTLGLSRFGAPCADDDGGLPGGLTTPDAVALQDALAHLRDAGVAHVALEASSIGLVQGRLTGCRVAVAVFTNLSRDHLDFHADMTAYADAKASLFAMPGLGAAVINGDDPAAGLMAARLPSDVPCIVFGRDPVGPAGARALRLLACEPTDHGSRLTIDADGGRASVELPVPGEFNARNALAVLGAWLHLGVAFDDACRRLETLAPVPGRLEQVGGLDTPLVLVDYAHTPDALGAVLAALRPHARARGGRLWCVFGCGGDRDSGKRPLMAAAAEAGADRIVLTSDNPRGEPPEAIIAQMRAGLSAAPWAEIPDRAEAITKVISEATESDVVLIAGKGHESTQEIAGERLPFSDVETGAAALAARQGGLH